MDHLMSPPWRVRGMQILAAALVAACGGGADTPAALSNGGSVPQVAPANGDGAADGAARRRRHSPVTSVRPW